MVYNDSLRPEQFKRTHKKKYTVHWMIAHPGLVVHNYFEDCTYITDKEHCVVMKGTCGEHWVLTLDKLFKTYNINLTMESVRKSAEQSILGNKVDTWHCATPKTNETVWAVKLPDRMKVDIQTAWGSILKANRDGIEHCGGDFVVCANNSRVSGGAPNLGDMWVVNGAVFRSTYDMRGFGKQNN